MDSRAEDQLSSLPNNVLATILSFLPTKSAASTTVLSRPWCRLWTQITALRFTLNTFRPVNTIFRGTIEWISTRQIQTIELNIVPPISITSYTELIRPLDYYAQSVKELKVITTKELYSLKLPIYVFGNKSLEVLDTHGFLLNNVNVKCKVPNLRKLIITVHVGDLQLFEKLVISSPLLEILQVRFDIYWEFKNTIEIKAQNLNWLSIHLVGEMYSLNGKKVIIDASKLRYLEVERFNVRKFCFLKTPSGLVKAKLFISGGFFLNLDFGLELINFILRVTSLNVSCHIIHSLSYLEWNVPIFLRFTHLKVGLSCSESLRGVKRFIKRCSSLQNLVLRREGRSKWDDRNRPAFSILPCTISKKIQRIELRNFDGSRYVLEFLSYILSSTKDLKMLDLITNEDFEEKTLIKNLDFRLELRKLSCKAPDCRIKITKLCCIHDGKEIKKGALINSSSGQTSANVNIVTQSARLPGRLAYLLHRLHYQVCQ